MANSNSASKRIQIAERNRLRNKAYKSAIKTFMKKYFNAVEAYSTDRSQENLDKLQEAMSVAYSKIDKAVKRGVIHGNNGSRKKARLAKALKRSMAEAS